MAYLANPTYTKAILAAHGFSMQKKYGQNFLIDVNVVQNIVDQGEITKEDCVLEIGPGIGTMTQYLCEAAKQVIAVEIDKALIPVLEDTLSTYKNVTVINEDILKVNIKELADKYNDGKPMKVVANLPYYITTPIIMELFEKKVPLKSITVMVQKEVAVRMQEGPGSKDYGALSLAVQYYSDAHMEFVVKPECFIPRPNVDSAVIRMDVYEKPPVEVKDEELLFKIIKATFGQRRKTMMNSLSNAPYLNLSKERVAEILEEMGKPLTVRGETFTLEEFAQFTNLCK